MKDNLNIYEEPDFEVTTFGAADILKTSGVDEGDRGENELPIG